jgi:pyruvate dehydrogenase E2 component (dihydrolipoamide acetyltransferase)
VYDVTMPRLSDSMEEGKIIAWKVAEGDAVSEGDVLAEVESDKAVMELECFRAGTLAEIVHGDGDEVAVGEVIARIAAKGEKPKAEEKKPEAKREEKPKPERPEKPEKKQPEKKEPKPEQPAEEAEEEEREDKEGQGGEAQRETFPKRHRVAISPYAKKLAESYGVDPSTLEGSGESGRIMARDVEAARKAGGKSAKKPPAERKPPEDEKGPAAEAQEARPPREAPLCIPPDEELPPLDVDEDEADVTQAPFRLRTQARRVVAAKHVVPHFYVTVSADVTALLQRRKELKEKIGATVTHLVLAACLKAIEKNPQVNRSYDRGNIVTWKGVHLGIAVDTDEGLTVAVLRDAQDLALDELAEAATALVERARAGRLAAKERRHPTFTVTNLGMFGVEHFQPILNPPSSITLGVASALPKPVVRGEGLYIGQVMALTASCDHRIVDGVTAARFLQDLKALLENPDALLGEGK